MAEERSFIAFISYRHKPLDIKAAKMIQKRIENFRVPKELQEKVGGSKLGYVFRDEDELPLSSSLSNSIIDALDRSQFLIVICTPDLPLSKWCEQEIRYFLQTHDHDHLLAVLADGSEDVSFSPLMLHNYDESGSIISDLEPLAANIVGYNHHISKKRFQKESLRVIACLIGCPFDTLYQREKRAKAFRIMAALVIIFSTLATFGSYAAIKTYQIAQQEKQIAEQAQLIVQEQKEKILSQAELLAEQAQEAYDQKAYTEALNKALLSMDLSDDNKEQQSRLKTILISCLNLYSRPDKASTFAVPTGLVTSRQGAEIEDFFLNSDSSRLFTIAGKQLSVWNTEDCSLISTYESSENIHSGYNFSSEAYLAENQTLFITWSESSIVCYEYESGKTVWTKGIDNSGYKLEKVLLSQDKDRIFSIRYSRTQENALIEEIDTATGSVIKEHHFFWNCQAYFGQTCDISPDNRYIACSGNTRNMQLALYIFDLELDTAAEVKLGRIDPWGSPNADYLLFTDDGRILVSRYDGSVNIRASTDYNLYEDKVGHKNFKIWCYDYLNSQIAWKYDTAISSDQKKSPLDYRDLQLPQIIYTKISDSKTVVAALGTNILLLNGKNGALMEEILLNANIVALWQQEDSLEMILENGNHEIFPKKFRSQEIRSVKNFPGSILQAYIGSECFYIRNHPDSIIKYELGKYDENYTETVLTGSAVRELYDKLQSDDRISEDETVRIAREPEHDHFSIISDSTYEVKAGDEIKAISLTPDGKRVFVGLKNQILLYDLEGTLLIRKNMNRTLYSSDDGIYVYFPEDTVCFYGDYNGGLLIDINENSMEINRLIENCVGYDQTDKKFIICDYYDLAENKFRVTAGYLKYYTLQEIRNIAVEAGF